MHIIWIAKPVVGLKAWRAMIGRETTVNIVVHKNPDTSGNVRFIFKSGLECYSDFASYSTMLDALKRMRNITV